MRRSLIALSLAVLLLAGCGGDDSPSDEATDDTTTETTGATEDTATDETTDEAGGDTEALCAELEALSDIDPEALPTQADVDRVTAAAESAPPEIAEALTVVAGVGQLIADEDIETLTPEQLAELEAQTSGPEITAAGETLVAYTADECGFDVPLFSSFT